MNILVMYLLKVLKANTKRSSYQIMLALIHKLIEGDLDQQMYEEYVRYIFGPDAYIVFTIDKLVLSIVRQVTIDWQKVQASVFNMIVPFRFTSSLQIHNLKSFMSYLSKKTKLNK